MFASYPQRPDVHEAADAAGDQRQAVGAEGQRPDRRDVSLQLEDAHGAVLSPTRRLQQNHPNVSFDLKLMENMTAYL